MSGGRKRGRRGAGSFFRDMSKEKKKKR